MNKMILGVILSLVPFSSKAELPTFNFVKVGYSELEFDLFEGDYVGYEAEASLELEDNFYMVGKYIVNSDDELDLDQLRGAVGFGYIQEITDHSALYIQIEYTAVRFERENSGQFEEKGAQYGIGYRGRPFDNFEYDVAVKQLNLGEVDPTFGDFNKTYISLGADYNVFESFALYVDYEVESDDTRYAAGLKYEF